MSVSTLFGMFKQSALCLAIVVGVSSSVMAGGDVDLSHGTTNAPQSMLSTDQQLKGCNSKTGTATTDFTFNVGDSIYLHIGGNLDVASGDTFNKTITAHVYIYYGPSEMTYVLKKTVKIERTNGAAITKDSSWAANGANPKGFQEVLISTVPAGKDGEVMNVKVVFEATPTVGAPLKVTKFQGFSVATQSGC